jgi:hypothetical protein
VDRSLHGQGAFFLPLLSDGFCFLDDFFQIGPLNMLHDQARTLLMDKRPEHLDHVGVVKVCLDLGLSQELISILLPLIERVREHFDDDLALENNVSCKVEFGHPASFKPVTNNVILDLLSWLEFGSSQLEFPRAVVCNWNPLKRSKYIRGTDLVQRESATLKGIDRGG